MFTNKKSFPWKSYLLRLVVPTVLTNILFISAFFFFIIPSIRNTSMDRKKEMIRELTTSAWNILDKFHADEKDGLLTRQQAQRQVIEQIRNLHYGQQMKDYFWINDMTPRMIIHPTRTELNGKDLSNYADPDGRNIFAEIVRVVAESGSGYVNYKWQADKSSPNIRLKISYVKGFSPWGWVIGTGIYIDDVNAEIDLLIKNIIAASTGIFVVNILIFLYILSVSYQTFMKQRASEMELEKARSSLALSEKMASLGTLSAMVAHEINNPLSGILSYAKLSIKYLERDGTDKAAVKSVIDNLSVIAGETKRCGEIVKNLLLFAKQSLGKVKKVHLNEVITLSTKVIDHSAKMKGIELMTELDAGDDSIHCDPGAIQQILVSLIVNSMESSSQGKQIIVRSDYADKENINIKVIDFGHGIAEADLPFIFDPFFSTKESNGSLGLGLSAVYGIVQHHKGTIDVESETGSGTVFSITLPRAYEEHNDI